MPHFILPNEMRSRTPYWLLGLVVLAIAAVLFFCRLGTRSLWTMEVRWGEIPREMLQSGDYFRPTINGQLYYDKPLGSYWLVLAASAITGRVDELAARLPSAVSALLAVALCMRLAALFFDGRTAILSGVILATCFSFVDFARTASADMENVAGELAALVLFAEYRRRPAGWWIVAFWLIMALTSLTKGLLGFALPVLIVGAFSAVYPGVEPLPGKHSLVAGLVRNQRWFFNAKTIVGLGLAAVVYFLPFAMSPDANRGLAMVFRENLQRFFAPVNHKGPIYLYVGAIFVLMAPWSALLPAALVHAHRRGTPSRDGTCFALVYFWMTFVFFTLSASRRSYYLLPILPAGALIIGHLLATPNYELSRLVRRLLLTGGGVITCLVLAAGFALIPHEALLPPPWNNLPELPAAPVFAAGWIVAVALMALALFTREPRRLGAAFGGVAILASSYLFLLALPGLEVHRGERKFAQDVARTIGSDTARLAIFRTRELVFYLNAPGPVTEYGDVETLKSDILAGRIRWLVVRQRDVAGLLHGGRIELAAEISPWADRNAATRALLLSFDSVAPPFAHSGKGG